MTLYETKMAQVEVEIADFCALLKVEGVLSYLEIGSRYGGSLWRAAHALPQGSTIVSIDMPESGLGSEQSLQQCIKALQAEGYDAHLILGNSTSPDIIETARNLGPFDAIFIDGDHSLPGVTADWNNYGPLGKIVAFHDIVWEGKPRKAWKPPCEVKPLWTELKAAYRHQEIVSPVNQKGIGVLWR